MEPLSRLIIFLFLLVFSEVAAHAQTYQHTAIWGRVAASYNVDKQWGLIGDLLYRRQSHPDRGLFRPFNSPLLSAGRVGVSYRTRHWQYSLFPVVLFYTYPALGNSIDLNRSPVLEFRPSAYAEWTLSLRPKSALRLRAGYEYRNFLTPRLPDLGRIRFRAAWRRGFGPHTYGQLWNETLVFGPPNSPVSGQVFDLNRTNASVGYALSNISTLEAGYQFTHRQRRSIIEFDNEQALTLTLFLTFNP